MMREGPVFRFGSVVDEKVAAFARSTYIFFFTGGESYGWLQ